MRQDKPELEKKKMGQVFGMRQNEPFLRVSQTDKVLKMSNNEQLIGTRNCVYTTAHTHKEHPLCLHLFCLHNRNHTFINETIASQIVLGSKLQQKRRFPSPRDLLLSVKPSP